MSRIRTMKPSFWGSPEAAHMTRDARLLVLGLVSMSDDDGRFLGNPIAIAGSVFPNDEDVTPAKLRRWLTEATDCGMVHLYVAEGVQYGCLPSWHKHQVINRYTPSSIPSPDIECAPRKAGRRDED